MNETETPVIFRVWNTGTKSVLAIFPELEGARVGLCRSYEHIGQHGDCQPRYIATKTHIATPTEYADLKRELESAPYLYKLRVVNRVKLYWWQKP